MLAGEHWLGKGRPWQGIKCSGCKMLAMAEHKQYSFPSARKYVSKVGSPLPHEHVTSVLEALHHQREMLMVRECADLFHCKGWDLERTKGGYGM
jgi:hypothetical protein